MQSQISDEQLGEAVLKSVQYGVYPDSEEVISADVPASALPVVLGILDSARDDVKLTHQFKNHIRGLSNEAAPDIDGWISQASQLHADIEKSKEVAHEILHRAEEEKLLQERLEDVTSKLDLLIGEVRFNETLAGTLEQVYTIQKRLDQVQEGALSGRLTEAIEDLNKADDDIARLQSIGNATVVGLLRDRATDLRRAIVENVGDYWGALIEVNRSEGRITVRNELQKSPELPLIDIQVVVDALAKLQLLKKAIDVFYQNFDSIILNSRLTLATDRNTAAISVSGDDIQVSGRNSDITVQHLFMDLNIMIEYLSTRLPPSVSTPVSQILIPSLTSRLISTWLASSVPPSLEGMQEYQEILALAVKLEEDIESVGWTAKGELLNWVERAPRVWLTRRREASLDSVRSILHRGFGKIKCVERVETQTVTRKQGFFGNNGGWDIWNETWSDEESEKPQAQPVNPSTEDEEDVSAWGLDVDVDVESDHPDISRQPTTEDDDGEIGEAWGWGDDGNDESLPNPDETKETGRTGETSNGTEAKPDREVTLKETYNITAIPESILEIIRKVVDDAEKLALPDYQSSPISPAATGLISLPTLILAMYRASATFYYTKDFSGNMFLYNDGLWLGERLREFSDTRAAHASAASPRITGKLSLESDIRHLETLGKRAYSREMESQRMILVDFLDGAQGFANCTTQPFAGECETAINSCIDRIRDIYGRWKDVLSYSALLQSVGLLVFTVTNKIIADVEDMGDIPEAESQRLASYCNRISTLEDLFVPQKATEASVPLTAIYAPNWLKFQYLATLLESSLADIKYLWSKGELRLEFQAQEVIDLIEALFADSEHRRKAIAEIRRSPDG
ncbi:hypothetical protein GP486_002428 [Trichoglossum hirsutum]|uniref:ZW10 C-terminal helical domain-containing protein n=1 Tax=Trichoglossum hirsutum TaxID=265104 RepID=A0A9P8LET0_9PEZI|nr:hypothetical protein GP486_002428 [Trichoglossum hirsutum]